jgi:hypothetical protein
MLTLSHRLAPPLPPPVCRPVRLLPTPLAPPPRPRTCVESTSSRAAMRKRSTLGSPVWGDGVRRRGRERQARADGGARGGAQALDQPSARCRRLAAPALCPPHPPISPPPPPAPLFMYSRPSSLAAAAASISSSSTISLHCLGAGGGGVSSVCRALRAVATNAARAYQLAATPPFCLSRPRGRPPWPRTPRPHPPCPLDEAVGCVPDELHRGERLALARDERREDGELRGHEGGARRGEGSGGMRIQADVGDRLRCFEVGRIQGPLRARRRTFHSGSRSVARCSVSLSAVYTA